MPMSEKELAQIVENEKEWRRHHWRQIEDMRTTQTQILTKLASLETKVKERSRVWGFVGGVAASLIVTVVGHAIIWFATGTLPKP